MVARKILLVDYSLFENGFVNYDYEVHSCDDEFGLMPFICFNGIDSDSRKVKIFGYMHQDNLEEIIH